MMACFCIPLHYIRCYGDILQTGVNDEDLHDVDMELEGNDALDIYDDAHAIEYL
jgi:hypothetical protein